MMKGVSFFLFFCIALVFLPYCPIAANKKCFAALDVVQVQDMTSSFDSRWSLMREQVEEIVKAVSDTGRHSYFGFTTFGDKNLNGFNKKSNERHSLGYQSDFCAQVELPLGKPDSVKIQAVFNRYSQLDIGGGGGDWPEGVLEGLYRSLVAPKMLWRSRVKGGSVRKVAVVVTDAMSHIKGDVKTLTGNKVRPFDITSSGIRENGDNENYDCDKVDYPSFAQLGKLIDRLDVTVLFLVAPGGKYNKKGKFVPFMSLANEGQKYRGEDGLMLWYQDKFHEAGVKNVVVSQLDSNMEGYGSAFKKILNDYRTSRCV